MWPPSARLELPFGQVGSFAVYRWIYGRSDGVRTHDAHIMELDTSLELA